MLEKVQAMLAEALNIPVEKITPDAKIVKDLGADSLDLIELLTQLKNSLNNKVRKTFGFQKSFFSFAENSSLFPIETFA